MDGTAAWVWKCNVDGTIFYTSGRTRCGAVARDSDGRVLVVLSGKFHGCRTPHLVELLGCPNILNYILSHFLGPDIVKIDALNVQKAFTTNEEDCFKFGFIVEDCKTLLTL